MDTIRLFFRSNSFRSSNRKPNLTTKHLRRPSNSHEINKSKSNLSIDIQNNQHSSNEKLSRDNIKTFLSTHPLSTPVVSGLPLHQMELETCSGLSTHSSNNTQDAILVASASESVSNALAFTNHHYLKRRRSSILSNQGRQHRRSWTAEQNLHHKSPLSLPIRRSRSHRYPDRLRKHSIKNKSSTGRLKRRYIQPFLSTYRQRNEEFRKIFKELPNDERLIVDYSCAWQKDILIQGRMYISQNYLCFYANILNWKTSLCLKFKDIVGITREKTAKLISNAIEVKSNKAEKYFFASFVTRDKTYELMIRIWKTTLIDQTISTHQLWKMIHESYGDDLDMTTDDEDTFHKSSLNSTPTKQEIKLSDKYDRITTNSLHSTSFQEDEDDYSSVSSRGEHQTDDEDIIPIGEEAKTNTLIRQPQSDLSQQDMTTTSETAEISYLSQCSCESHLATKLIDRTYSMSVERLFDCIFGANDFLVAYRAARRIKGFHATEWQLNEETGRRERLCTYKVDVTAVFGQTTVCSSEKQVIDSELSKSHYLIDTEVRNEGIKYADAFFVASRYCLVQIGRNKSHLKVTCEVRYVKSLMMIIKYNRLDLSTSSVKRIDHESSHRPRSSSNSNINEKEKVIKSPSVSNKKPSRKPQSNELTSSNNDLSINSQREELIQHQTNSDVALSDPLTSSRHTFLVPFCIITMLLLLIVNIFLCIKLNQIDQMTDRLVQSYPSWLNKYSYQQEDNEWSLLLKRQEEYYQTQLTGLHSVLISTHNALRNVTDALNQLSKLSSRSS